MSWRCTLTIPLLLMGLVVTSGCGFRPAGAGEGNNPTPTAHEALPQLGASYQKLVALLDAGLCHFAAVAASTTTGTQQLKLAASTLAKVSNSVTNHLARLAWPTKLQADSQVLIRAIAAVEGELRAAASRTTAASVTRHVQTARQLIARISSAGSQLRTDLHLTEKTACG